LFVENIIKTYGKKKEVTALSDISFAVPQGEMFGIIGHDGAGKTSCSEFLRHYYLQIVESNSGWI
jgi:ABC-type uncharacterized transport system ATPase subunit